MNLTKRTKICASVLLAIMIVGMPLYVMGNNIFASSDGIEYAIVKEGTDIEQTEYSMYIQMTASTEFVLGTRIDLSEQFPDSGSVLEYACEYDHDLSSVVINVPYLHSITTRDIVVYPCLTTEITVVATYADHEVLANYLLMIFPREIMTVPEDTRTTWDVSNYLNIDVPEYNFDSSDEITIVEIDANANGASVSFVSDPNWYGAGMFSLATHYDSPYLYGYFEYDVNVLNVNDPPYVNEDITYMFELTNDASFTLLDSLGLELIFQDVDSDLSFSWSSMNHTSGIYIYDQYISSVYSFEETGLDTITLIANDGEYFTTFNILVNVIPKMNVEMIEDNPLTLDMQYFINIENQDYRVTGSENLNIGVTVDPYGVAEANLTSTQDWFGMEEVTLMTFPELYSIVPPHLPPSITATPIPPIIIPPLPVVDTVYGFYEFDVDVAPVNDPPYAIEPATIVMSEDENLVDVFNIMDCFGDVDSTLVYDIVQSQSSKVNAEIGYGGTVSLTPTPNWFGTQQVNLTAYDGEFSVSQNVSVEVLSMNDVPFATDMGTTIAVDEDTSATVYLDDYILDIEDPLWYSFVCNDMNSTMELNEATWELSVTPDENWNGVIEMMIYGSDSECELARSLTLDIAAVNDAPEIISTRNLTMDEGSYLDLDLSTFITDVDSELDFTVFSCGGKLECEMVQGTMWTVCAFPGNGNWNGNEIIRIIAYDGQYMINLNLNVEVLAVNNVPIQMSRIDQISMAEDSTFTLAISDLFADVDGDELGFACGSGGNLQLGYDEETMMLSVNPVEDWYGDSTVSVQAFDGEAWTTMEIPVSVAPVNDPPQLTGDIPAIAMAVGNSTDISLASFFSDVDSLVLTIEVLGTDSLTVTAMEANGMFNVQSIDTWEGTQTLNVRVSDGIDVTETKIAVTTYVPLVTMETTTIEGGAFLDSAYWMVFGMAMVVALFVTYTAIDKRKSYTRAATNKTQVL